MYLIIVESPAKAGKIQKYLDDEFGKGLYNVKASYGHIRSLEVSPNTINVNNWEIKFVNDKHKVIKELKTVSRGKEVILASDEDREGEAIAWHLQEVLKIKEAFVDGGPVMKRFRAASMGRASRLRRPTSHLTIVVSDEN